MQFYNLINPSSPRPHLPPSLPLYWACQLTLYPHSPSPPPHTHTSMCDIETSKSGDAQSRGIKNTRKKVWGDPNESFDIFFGVVGRCSKALGHWAINYTCLNTSASPKN
jgi:hypothetical protein